MGSQVSFPQWVLGPTGQGSAQSWLPGLVLESGLVRSIRRTWEVGGGSQCRCHGSSPTGVVPDVRCVPVSTSDIWKS